MKRQQTLVCRSIGRSLKYAPSRFSHIAIVNYFRAQRLLDVAWLGLAVLWFAYSSSTTIGLGTVAEAQYLAMAVMVLLVCTAAGQVWTHRVMTRELGQTWSSTDDAENAAVQIDEQGYFQSAGRDVDPGIARCMYPFPYRLEQITVSSLQNAHAFAVSDAG